ncbi:MAG: MotA/TolQ/ExbB proton channel family protein, partial [Pseudomonadota bacterium]
MPFPQLAWLTQVLSALADFLNRGGPAMWAIFGLSVVTLAIVLWKLWHFARLGAWARFPHRPLRHWVEADPQRAVGTLTKRRCIRTDIARWAMVHSLDPALEPASAREETLREAKAALAEAGRGLRALELIGTVAPLLGLFGTVLGMIAAFQALQEAGSRADPSALAGGIW